MKTKVLFIERKVSEAISIEKVFRQIAKSLSEDKFKYEFEQVPYKTNLLGTIKNLLLYRHSKSDIYHITGHVHFVSLLLPKNKTLLTVHDTGILNIRKGIRRYILKKILFDLPVKKLKFITVISEKTKKDIINYTNCDEKKIRVIENPLREEFQINNKPNFNADCPVILQIGTTYNKNLPNLIKSLSEIRCRLVIVGRLDETIVRLLVEKSIEYENLINITDAELVKQYIRADIVTFCSTFEGFGLPIIEAQAMKTPVITSNISPMKEVAGNGAMLVEPESVESIKEGFLKIINDGQFRKKMVENGIDNVKRFNSISIARNYETLYEEIIKSNT